MYIVDITDGRTNERTSWTIFTAAERG